MRIREALDRLVSAAEGGPGETASFSYEIHNAREVGGNPDLGAEYRYFVKTEDDLRSISQPIVIPHQSSASLAHSIVLRGRPETPYRARVHARDDRTHDTVMREATFRVAGAACPP